MSHKSLGLIYGLLAAVCFGTMNFLVNLFSKQFPPSEIAGFRGLIGALVLTPFVFRSIKLLSSRRSWVLWARCIAGAVSVLCLFINLQETTVGHATVLANFSAVFLVLISRLFLREIVSTIEWVGMGLVLSGAFLLQSPAGSALPVRNLMIGCLGAFSACLAYLSLRQAAQKFPPQLIVWLFCVLSGGVAYLYPGERWELALGMDFFILTLIGVLGLFGQILMTHAYMRLPASIACILSLSAVCWGVLLESAYFSYLPNIGTAGSYSLILLGVYLLQTQYNNPEKRL